VLLAYGARYAFHSELAFYVLLGFAAMLGAGLYGMALESARDAAERRKEQIIAELSRNDGPVATG
jgi:ABC-2 type transport system permease protein